MLLKRDSRENSGGTEMSKKKKKTRLSRVTRNLQWWWGCFRGLGAELPALKNSAVFCKSNLILGLFW